MGIGIPHEEATTATTAGTPGTFEPRHPGRGYTSSQPIPYLVDIPVFLTQHAKWATPLNGEAPAPYPWVPKFLREQWVYTDGSDITGHPHLGAAVVHIPNNTTIYIDVAGIEETRTIMRA